MRSIAYFVAGIVVGILGTVGLYLFVNRDTVVYETIQPVVAEGIQIPKGTKLIHDTEMSEGFDTLRLYVNVNPQELDTYFKRSVDDRGLLVIPYWVNETADRQHAGGRG